MKMFNSNYLELGSLDLNLILNTQGKIKIRYGKKFVDLIDEEGNINISNIIKDQLKNISSNLSTNNLQLASINSNLDINNEEGTVGGLRSRTRSQFENTYTKEECNDLFQYKGDYVKYLDLKSIAFTSDYNDLINKPINVSSFINDAGYLTSHLSLANYALKSELFSGDYDDLTNKPDLSIYLTSHLSLSDYALKSELFSGSYNDLTDKPTIPTNSIYVDLTNAQTITGVKTFTGDKRILFKLQNSNNKLGFTLYDNNNNEVGFLEYRGATVGNYPLLTLGNYHGSANINPTYIGIRNYDNIDSSLYHILAPLAKDIKNDFSLTTTATNFYFPLGFTDGSTTVVADSKGIVNISSLIPSGGGGGLSTQIQSDWNLSNSSSIDFIKNKPSIPSIWKGTQTQYDNLQSVDPDTLYVIV